MQIDSVLANIQARFEANMHRHAEVSWDAVLKKIKQNKSLQGALLWMEETGGEPDVISTFAWADVCFVDCSPESPPGRRSLCYDAEALESRKQNKPVNSALGLAAEVGVEVLNEQEYIALQEFGPFDTKTSSWIVTPDELRSRGGALFGDWRYGRTFIYHNGAESYYAARGFRCKLVVH